MNRLTRDFFERKPEVVAKELIGKTFVFHGITSLICETEAYGGFDDAASHAFRGLTPRNAPMFGPAGHLYVYFIYGMHHCVNIVTERKGLPSAVLIRGLQVLNPSHLLDGPGKICRYLGIDRKMNHVDCINNPLIYLEEIPSSLPIHQSERRGISKNKDKLWRFYTEGSL